MKIFLDLDGVLVDFVGGICKWFNKPYPYDSPESKGVWEIDQLIGITHGAFWAAFHDIQFWQDLSWTKDGNDILEAAVRYAGDERNVYLITNPSAVSCVFYGKAAWVNNRLGTSWLDRTIMVKDKSLLAKPKHILIDDNDDNVDKFFRAGGTALLIPRPWNSMNDVAISSVDSIKMFFKELGEP